MVILLVLSQLVLSAYAMADWVETFSIVAMPILRVLHLDYRGRPCLSLKKARTLWRLMRMKRESR